MSLEPLREEIVDLLNRAGALSLSDIAMNLVEEPTRVSQAVAVLRKRGAIKLAANVTANAYMYEVDDSKEGI